MYMYFAFTTGCIGQPSQDMFKIIIDTSIAKDYSKIDKQCLHHSWTRKPQNLLLGK